MSYKVRIARHVERRINTWGLPDELLVEVHLRLRDRLPQDPTGLLHRTRKPFDGMEYRFALMDLTNRFCEHLCFFHVVYVRLLPFLTGAQTSGNPLFNSAETSARGSSPWVFETPRCGAGVSKKRGCPFSQDFLAFRSPEKGKSRTMARTRKRLKSSIAGICAA